MFLTRKLLGGGRVATLLKTLNSEIRYFFKIEDPITPLPHPPPGRVYPSGNLETIPYRQDIMTSFGCVCDRSTVFTHFSGQFSKMYTSVLVNRSFHAKEQFHYSIAQKQC